MRSHRFSFSEHFEAVVLMFNILFCFCVTIAEHSNFEDVEFNIMVHARRGKSIAATIQLAVLTDKKRELGFYSL